jgi:hypothetical protein
VPNRTLEAKPQQGPHGEPHGQGKQQSEQYETQHFHAVVPPADRKRRFGARSEPKASEVQISRRA